MPLDAKRAKSQHVIDNSGSREETRAQVTDPFMFAHARGNTGIPCFVPIPLQATWDFMVLNAVSEGSCCAWRTCAAGERLGEAEEGAVVAGAPAVPCSCHCHACPGCNPHLPPVNSQAVYTKQMHLCFCVFSQVPSRSGIRCISACQTIMLHVQLIRSHTSTSSCS